LRYQRFDKLVVFGSIIAANRSDTKLPFGTKRDIEQVKQLQGQILSMQKQIGWTNTQLANVIYCELNDDDDYVSMSKFAETLKKQLKRETTNPKLLERYIKLISAHDDFRKSAMVFANPIRLGLVDYKILDALRTNSQQRIKELE
jgi:hypothetical protein